MTAARCTVLVPVQAPAPALDACLASLDRCLAPGAPVRVVDDGGSDPRASALAESWCQRTGLDASYSRRPHPIGLAASLECAFDDIPDDDLLLLRGDAEATAGFVTRLQATAASQPRVACVSAWSGEGELAAFVDATPAESVAAAAASLQWPSPPPLPAAAGPAIYLRREAMRALGGLDTASFRGWGALDDFCRRAEALGWHNLLCLSAYVAAAPGGATTLGEIERLLVRWPDFQERVARFILEDPLGPLRESLRARIAERERGGPQGDLFGH